MTSVDSNSKDVAFGENALLEIVDGIAWVTLNRPDKRNAISPGIVREMNAILDEVESNDEAKVMVITGAGDAFSAGQDLKEYFRIPDTWPAIERERLYRANSQWQWRRMMYFPKPTIAMVNGWCFGGAFQFMIACDLALASEDATFGLSEINWGIIPAGIVTKSVSMVMNQRDCLYYIMTGDTFDGTKAAEMGLVNFAVPKDDLRARTIALAEKLKEKNPVVLRAAKSAYHHVRTMNWDTANEYLMAKHGQTAAIDPERGAEKGMSQFLDEKSYRPGLGAYRRED
ncbi:trans-feruloyl-CoA hydratase/vanillin synthase [Amorphus suaedae]